jgi:tRNA(adenine34) deaminase
MCAGAIVHARIGRVVFGANDVKTGAVISLYQLLSDKRLNHQTEIVGGVMADAAARLLKQFFKNRRKSMRLNGFH